MLDLYFDLIKFKNEKLDSHIQVVPSILKFSIRYFIIHFIKKFILIIFGNYNDQFLNLNLY